MNIPLWQDQLAGTVIAFTDELQHRGFEPDADNEDWWAGPIDVVDGTGADITSIFKIAMPKGFPFAPPIVFTATPPAAYTWHLQPPGHLCLWRQEDNADRPWETVDALFARVRSWHEHAAAGWPGDPGDPDMNRYFSTCPDDMVFTFGDLDTLVGHHLARRTAAGKRWVELSATATPNAKELRKRRQWAYASDLGALTDPVWDWPTLLAAVVNSDDRDRIEELVAIVGTGLLLLRYVRPTEHGDREAAIVLETIWREDDVPWLCAKNAIQNTDETRTFRSGTTHRIFEGATIAIVGCGAVGSFLAEQLARDGAHKLVLVDPEQLLPGNCVRHLADPRHIGRSKVEAIRLVLEERSLRPDGGIDVFTERLTPNGAFELLTTCDVVIDAAADGEATGLLVHIADLTGTSVVKVALHRDGGLIRVDRYGPHTIDQHLDPIPGGEPAGFDFREAGCGDPVSPTPPHAVFAAASAAAAWAADTLLPFRRRRLPDSWIEVREPQPDEPYTTTRILLP